MLQVFHPVQSSPIQLQSIDTIDWYLNTILFPDARLAARRVVALAFLSFRLATASSEARVLKASGEDAEAKIARLGEELGGKESRLAGSVAEAGRLREELASSEAQRDAARVELAEVQSAMDTGAADFVTLESKLCEAESTCERLRAGVEITEMEMSEVCVCVSVCVFFSSTFSSSSCSFVLQEEVWVGKWGG